MDLTLSRKSQLPLHVQLKAQLVHLIQAGQLPPSGQLPTVRQLAGFLRINRNTVAKVFTELEREGYLSCQRGRGTFVTPPADGAPPTAGRMRTLLSVVEDAIGRASDLGYTPAEFAAALYTRAHTAPAPPPVAKLPALFVECNRPQLERFSLELLETLPLELDRILVKDLARAVRKRPASFERYAVAITTFFHVHEVEKLLGRSRIEVVGLLAEASLETLLRLTSLPAGTKVGVACNAWTGTENVQMSIRNAGLTHIDLVPGCGADVGSLRRMLKEARVVVCSSLVEGRLKTLAAPGTEIIVDDRRLDPAGIEMLRARLGLLRRRPSKEAAAARGPREDGHG